MGLIDVLTQYDTKKKAAHAAKAVKHGVRECCLKGSVSHVQPLHLYPAKSKGLLFFFSHL